MADAGRGTRAMSLADTATADIAAEAQVRTEKISGRVLATPMDNLTDQSLYYYYYKCSIILVGY
jgi:hypothetical protein